MDELENRTDNGFEREETNEESNAEEVVTTGDTERATYTYTEEVIPSASTEPEVKKKKVKKTKVKKEKKPAGIFKKILTAVLVGILFGAFAAGAFYAMNRFVFKTDLFNPQTDNSRIAEIEKQVDNLKNLVVSSPDSYSTVATLVTTDVTTVAEKVMPAMVCVTNVAEVTTSDWFGRLYSYDSESCGSGIIIGENDSEYFIATNHHVIENSKTLSVIFVDDTTAEAYVKGYDSDIDVAVIGVQKSTLEDSTKAAISVAELGDSDFLRIGEPAIAIGNALGYGQSVTTGVVSAISRDLTIDSVTYENLIQTSAAINPGNSGGALLNVSGQVIGINSSKIASSTVEGMGFAIPISEVKDILKAFSDRETKVKLSDEEKGYLGITGTQDDLTAFGYPQGAYVFAVSEDGPAAAAGIYEGDVITKVDGQSITGLASLQELLSYYAPGETVSVTVQRRENGKFVEVTVDVTLTKRPEE